MKVLLSLCLLALACSLGQAQFAPVEKRIAKSIRKERWDKAKADIQKSLAKDSVDAGVEYLYSTYFFAPNSPAFHIDSAYVFVQKALIDLQQLKEKDRDRLKRLSIDSGAMVELRHRIDSAAFTRAKSINTESSYLYFLSNFPTAMQRDEAASLRDEAAYQDAVKADTYQGFLQFIEKYPRAAREPEARQRYERLLYEAKTSARTLSSYEQFLREYPATPYRREVERHIFELSTLSGRVESYVRFIQEFPRSPFASRARDILFHIWRENMDAFDFNPLLNDSLKNIQALNQSYWIATFREGRFGFMNSEGVTTMKPFAFEVEPEYKCGNVDSDVLYVDKTLIARDGHKLSSEKIESFNDIGHGFLTVKTNECNRVLHKSGFVVSDCIDDANVVADRFMALKKNNKWSLQSLAGRQLLGYDLDEIISAGEILICKREGRIVLTTVGEIDRFTEGSEIKLSQPFDDARLLTDQIWVKSGDQQALLNKDLEFVLPLENQSFEQTFIGILRFRDSTYSLLDDTRERSFKEVIPHKPWIALKPDSSWRLAYQDVDRLKRFRYDSIRFEGPFAIAFQGDSTHVHFTPDIRIEFPERVEAQFLPGKDSTAFLIVQSRRRELYDFNGRKLFEFDYDNIQHAGQGFFVVNKKDKKGLISSEGKVILQPEYEAIGSVVDNVVTLLKNKKFGAYNVQLKKLIKPQYHKNINVYNRKFLVAFSKSACAFTDWDNKPISKFEFNDIQYWNDSSALVKKNFNWVIFDINRLRPVVSGIRNVKPVTESPDEKLVIVQEETSFGVLSNTRGFIVPPTFSYIMNVGSSENPVFFTEKHVEEASIFVVIYFDRNGKMLYRQVYEEQDYEQIFCSDN